MVYRDRIAQHKMFGGQEVECHACLLSVDALQNKERHVRDENRRTRSYRVCQKDTLKASMPGDTAVNGQFGHTPPAAELIE